MGIEFGVAGIGAAFLLIRRKSAYLAPWICLVVGVHFYPIASVLQNAGLYVLATVLTIVALAAAPIARRRDLAISAVAGAGAAHHCFSSLPGRRSPWPYDHGIELSGPQRRRTGADSRHSGDSGFLLVGGSEGASHRDDDSASLTMMSGWGGPAKRAGQGIGNRR